MPDKLPTNRLPSGRPRPSAHKRSYDARHRKIRAHVLMRDPLCVLCPIYRPGELVNPSTEADHIDPASRGRDDLTEVDYQGTCKWCNGRKGNRPNPRPGKLGEGGVNL